MPIPSFVQASTPNTDAGGAWTATGTAASAVGNVIIAQVLQDGTTGGAVTVSSATNIENLAGTDNQWTSIGAFTGGSTIQHLFIGRAINTTSAPTIVGGNSTSEDLFYRFYEFKDVTAATALSNVIEHNAGSTPSSASGTGTTVSDAGVITNGGNRLALNFVGLADDLAVTAFTGETGGDWSEAVAGYTTSSGTDASIQLQIANMVSAGTIDGGAYSISASVGWQSVGFALRPDPNATIVGVAATVGSSATSATVIHSETVTSVAATVGVSANQDIASITVGPEAATVAAVATAATASTGSSPDKTISVTANGTVGAVGNVPTLVHDETVTSVAAEVGSLGNVPSVQRSKTVVGVAAEVGASGVIPTVIHSETVAPDAATVGVVANVPSVQHSETVAPDAAVVGVSASDPSAFRSKTVTGVAATVGASSTSATVSRSKTVTGVAATVGVSGVSPTLVHSETVTSVAATVGATATEPTIVVGELIAPDAATVGVVGNVPTVVHSETVTSVAAVIGASPSSPAVEIKIGPSAATVGVSGNAPYATITIPPASATVGSVGNAPVPAIVVPTVAATIGAAPSSPIPSLSLALSAALVAAQATAATAATSVSSSVSYSASPSAAVVGVSANQDIASILVGPTAATVGAAATSAVQSETSNLRTLFATVATVGCAGVVPDYVGTPSSTRTITPGAAILRASSGIIPMASGTATTFNVGTSSNQRIARFFQAHDDADDVSIAFSVTAVGTPSDDLRVSVWRSSGFVPAIELGWTVIDVPSVTSGTVEISLPLTASSYYWLVYNRTGSVSDTNYYQVRGESTGALVKYYDGSSWVTTSGDFYGTVQSDVDDGSYPRIVTIDGSTPGTVVAVAATVGVSANTDIASIFVAPIAATVGAVATSAARTSPTGRTIVPPSASVSVDVSDLPGTTTETQIIDAANIGASPSTPSIVKVQPATTIRLFIPGEPTLPGSSTYPGGSTYPGVSGYVSLAPTVGVAGNIPSSLAKSSTISPPAATVGATGVEPDTDRGPGSLDDVATTGVVCSAPSIIISSNIFPAAATVGAGIGSDTISKVFIISSVECIDMDISQEGDLDLLSLSGSSPGLLSLTPLE